MFWAALTGLGMLLNVYTWAFSLGCHIMGFQPFRCGARREFSVCLPRRAGSDCAREPKPPNLPDVHRVAVHHRRRVVSLGYDFPRVASPPTFLESRISVPLPRARIAPAASGGAVLGSGRADPVLWNREQVAGAERYLVLTGVAVLYGAVLAWMTRVLTRSDVEELFHSHA